jgi:hypothetical protein
VVICREKLNCKTPQIELLQKELDGSDWLTLIWQSSHRFPIYWLVFH